MKQWMMFFLILTSVVPCYAESIVAVEEVDLFSHTILTLPNEPQENEPWVKIMQTQEEWEAFFYTTTQFRVPAAPVFDFAQYQVISGGLGMHSSGGFYLAIERVFEHENTVSVHVLNITPAAGCPVTFALTYPAITFLIKKTDKPIHFSLSDLVQSCSE